MKKLSTVLLLLVWYTALAYSQEKRTEFVIDFRMDSAVVDTTYSGNAATIKRMLEFFRMVRRDTANYVKEVDFVGTASPEGGNTYNIKLARARMAAIENLVGEEIAIMDTVITRADVHTPWEELTLMVKDSDWKYRDTVLAIMSQDDYVRKLRTLDRGRAWKQIDRLFFSRMRHASAVIITYTTPPINEIPAVAYSAVTEPAAISETVRTAPAVPAQEEVVATDEWSRKVTVKSNAIMLSMAISNAAAEFDLIKHLSLNVPVYYSALNYFTETIKFRVFSVQPELRWWPSASNDGFFAGLHLGFTSFNIAVDGAYRYQDQNMKSPALGGGLNVGYRLPFKKNKNWKVEFSLGAGAWYVRYDKFYNTADTKDGLLAGSGKKTYIGPDQAAVSFSYSFDLKKKGGRQ